MGQSTKVGHIHTAEAIKMQYRESNSVLGDHKMSEEMLVPIDQYLKSGIHIGTKFKTKYMSNFIYKSRPDGLYVLNLQKIDERIRTAAKFLSQYSPDEIVVVSRRENGWRPAKMFGKVTGTKIFAGRYPPGVMTNPELKTYFEPKVIVVTDPWPDRNAILDAAKAGVTVISLCDTNNQTNNIDLVLPCNNKGKKSLGLLFWILAREYMKAKKAGDITQTAEDFTEE